LDALRNLWREYGGLSHKLIKRTKSVPSVYTYCTRFGSLLEAYYRIGFHPTYHPFKVKPRTRPAPSWRSSLV
jgi:hypothetical protein